MRLAVLFMVKVLGTFMLPAGNGFKELWRKRRSESWQLVSGKVRGTTVDVKQQLYSVSVHYGYSVNGENYPGTLEAQFAWKFQSDRYISRLASGPGFMVRYNPSNPEELVYRKDDQPATISG